MRRRGYKKTKLVRQGCYSESGEQTLSSEELAWVAKSCYSESWCEQHSWREGIPTPFFFAESYTWKLIINMIDWLVHFNCMSTWSYFIPRGFRIAYNVHLYLYFLCIFLWVFVMKEKNKFSSVRKIEFNEKWVLSWERKIYLQITF